MNSQLLLNRASRIHRRQMTIFAIKRDNFPGFFPGRVIKFQPAVVMKKNYLSSSRGDQKVGRGVSLSKTGKDMYLNLQKLKVQIDHSK